jgi:hypothetical protein
MDSLVRLVVVVIVFGLLYWLTTLIPLPYPFHLVLLVLFVLVAIGYLLKFAGLWNPPKA